jgi:hypothetical protein
MSSLDMQFLAAYDMVTYSVGFVDKASGLVATVGSISNVAHVYFCCPQRSKLGRRSYFIPVSVCLG